MPWGNEARRAGDKMLLFAEVEDPDMILLSLWFITFGESFLPKPRASSSAAMSDLQAATGFHFFISGSREGHRHITIR